MAFGASVSDILKGLELCKWLWDNHFDQNNSANRQYNEFRNDIRGLETYLNYLHKALDEVASLTADPYSENVPSFEYSKEPIGDFCSTLEQCRELIQKCGYLDKKKANLPTSVTWAVTYAPEVDRLRKAVSFHTQKISLILGPVELGLSAKFGGDLAELLEATRAQEMRDKAEVLAQISPWLDTLFRQTLGKDCPFDLTDVHTIPLETGCNALYRHFTQSTYQIETLGAERQTIEHYLELLKSQWLVSILRETNEFGRRRPGFVFRRCISNIELLVYKEYKRRDLVRFGDEDLQLHRDNNHASFLIWEPVRPRPPKRVTDAESDEEKLEISPVLQLAQTRDTKDARLTCFRKGTEDWLVRIVRTVEPDDPLHPDEGEERLNTRMGRLIPRYATESSRDRQTIEIHRGDGTGKVVYDFRGLEEAWSFQRAITGYQIVADAVDVTWTPFGRLFTGSKKMKKLQGTGRAQVWHWKPWTARSDIIPIQTQATPVPSSISQESQKLRIAEVETLPPKSPPSRAASSFGAASTFTLVPPPNQRLIKVGGRPGADTVIALQPPAPPAIIFFQHSNGYHSYFHFELNRHIKVDPTSCECKKSPDTCRRLVIEPSSSGAAFTTTSLSVPDTSLQDWDLNIFGGPGHHPTYYKRDGLEFDKCQHVKLEFDTPERRRAFATQLERAMVAYKAADVTYRRLDKKAQDMANRPDRTYGHGGDDPYQEIRRGPPVLRPVSPVSRFQPFPET